MSSFQSKLVGTTLIFFDSLSRATTPGESSPPRIMTVGVSLRALPITPDATLPTPNVSNGMTSVGIIIVESSVRRSRSESFNSLR